MVELIYAPPFKSFCTAFNTQYRLIGRKRFTFALIGGIKFFFVPGADFSNILPLRGNNNIWYLNIGLLCQFDLGVISPFVDIGGDRIITIGTELNLRKIYKKPKSRYRLKARPVAPGGGRNR